MNSIQDFLPVGHPNRPEQKIRPLYLVIHWTANTGKGANAQANRNYFARKNPDRLASAHYCVDSVGAVQVLPDNEMGYHVGATKYQHLTCRNTNSIGIEMCVNSDGDFTMMEANTVALAVELCKRWNINPDKNMLRHYDVTGKDCPRFYVSNQAAWGRFKTRVKQLLTAANKPKEDESVNPINISLPTTEGVKTIQGIVTKEGVSYFPIRVLEQLGYKVDWKETGQVDTVTVTKK